MYRSMTARIASVAVVLVAAMLPGHASAAAPPENTAPPAVTGEPVYRAQVVAFPGSWGAESDLTFSYQWTRGSHPIADATGKRYRPRLRDIGRRLRVEVTATDEAGESTTATSAAVEVRRATFRLVDRPSVAGTMRYTRVVEADPGTWSVKPGTITYRWFRDGTRIRGAKHRRYRLQAADVGHRVKVQVTVRKEGYRRDRAQSRRTRDVMHRVALRRTATYRIETRGTITARMRVFRRQVAQTFADPRGWRSAGVGFRRVKKGGDFSVVLAEASTVPSFSSVCSAQWSCRVGRYVIINQLRWKNASPSWNRARKPLREYRHMVVNHETGHWLGHGHLGCGADRRLAPVMMQQSKGLDGCRHNPWPLASELWYR
ncbi:DUF3152 domain-containing protein [Nocardioides sp.]|uniref:DUF3152 domain-containing protein n=1 Tax=Nocardioides sp. TaxID=35761 RepID=UPI002ED2D1FE